MTFRSTKTYGHEIGLSACFRQWRAHSHCNLLHGYALAFSFIFEADELDQCNWVVDFGGMKSLKGILEDAFDHKLLVAEDDPDRDFFATWHGIADVITLPAVGCEAFAQYAGEAADLWLLDNGYKPRVRLVSCECKEHGANSAIWINKDA